MTAPKYLFVDDATGDGGDAEHYRKMLSKPGVLDVELDRPNRDRLLVPDAELGPIDGFILDINLGDQLAADGTRFMGTGAGLAQDLRLLQSLGAANGGQHPRPIVRLCAAQVHQAYLEGDDSTNDIFDLGFSKESIGDYAAVARTKLAALPKFYADVERSEPGSACELLGISGDQYAALHSQFRGELEIELGRKTHEAANFILRKLINAPGILIDEQLLAVRLGIHTAESRGWASVKERFETARYQGTGGEAFARWWNPSLSSVWAELHSVPLFKLSAAQRVEVLRDSGFDEIVALRPDERSPGDRPWAISRSNDPELRLPVDPRFAFSLNVPLVPWLDESFWCFEMAKRSRNSVELSTDARSRLNAVLAKAAGKIEE